MIQRLTALALALVFLGVACDAEQPSGPVPSGAVSTLAGTSWAVVTVGGRAPVPGAVPTIQFSADQVTGRGGCNGIGGRYQLDPSTGRFAVTDLGGTAAGCLKPGVNEFETAFMQALGSATQATLDPNGQLIVTGTGAPIVFVRIEPPVAVPIGPSVDPAPS